MNPSDDRWMRTHTRATFAHYVDVKPFAAGASADDPFSGDDAAQHHVFDDGWYWLLRMNQEITSVGIVETMRETAGSEHPHSTGIARSLSGVTRIAEALLDQASQRDRPLARYATQLRRPRNRVDSSSVAIGCSLQLKE